MADCIFCKIVGGEIPCAVVYDDEHTLAFLDINPIAQGHTLVITRQHFKLLTDVPQPDLMHLVEATQRVARAVVAATGAEGFSILQSNGACAAQVVPHIHFHVIPRRPNDGLHFVEQRHDLTDEQRDSVAENIRAHL